MIVITDRKKIAREYLSGWFSIDLIAIIPFDLMFADSQAAEYNALVRVARFGRLYKLVKLTKILRVIKVIKNQKRMKKLMSDVVKVGMGFERLTVFSIIFFMLCHLCACLWIIMATLVNDETYSDTWLDKYKTTIEGVGEEEDRHELSSGVYTIALYWTITTITTVGYGDISGTNNLERVFCSLIMIIGVISFSFANGTLATILASTDSANVIQ